MKGFFTGKDWLGSGWGLFESTIRGFRITTKTLKKLELGTS
jgi:hypothetical protein